MGKGGKRREKEGKGGKKREKESYKSKSILARLYLSIVFLIL